MSPADGYHTVAIAGSGTIACGLAACASEHGEVTLLARSDESAERARETLEAICGKVDGAQVERVTVTTAEADLAGCDVIVEAIVEETEAKAELLSRLGDVAAEADLATTTSSLSIGEIGERSGHPDRVLGLHVFNPVPKMDLVELCLPPSLREGAGERARAWCELLGKHAVEVPDQAGFVVNRLLFPYLFDAVRMMERTGMSAADVDECMTLGTGHPMGPLRLLDFVGLDVAEAIGDALHADSGDATHTPPGRLVELVSEGKLGRKAGAGFYEY